MNEMEEERIPLVFEEPKNQLDLPIGYNIKLRYLYSNLSSIIDVQV